MVRRTRKEKPADFELIFTEHGTALLQRPGSSRPIWSSDDDDEFAEEFDDDFFDDDDSEDIIRYLDEREYIDSTVDIIDIIERDLEDDDDEVRTGEYISRDDKDR